MKTFKDVLIMDVSNVSFANIHEFSRMLEIVALCGTIDGYMWDLMMTW